MTEISENVHLLRLAKRRINRFSLRQGGSTVQAALQQQDRAADGRGVFDRVVPVIAGSGRFNQARNFHNPEVLDLVYMHQFSARLTYNLEALLGYTTHVPDIGTAHWFGVLHYVTYVFTPRLSGTTRLEFFDDEQGQRTGFAGLYTALTARISFRPRKSIIFRPELRYDYNEESRPFEGKHGLFTATSDLVLRW